MTLRLEFPQPEFTAEEIGERKKNDLQLSENGGQPENRTTGHPKPFTFSFRSSSMEGREFQRTPL